MSHWSFREMQECFGFSLDQYLFYGGYPGAAVLIGDEDRFGQYIQSAIIEATINKDILMDTPMASLLCFARPSSWAQRIRVNCFR